MTEGGIIWPQPKAEYLIKGRIIWPNLMIIKMMVSVQVVGRPQETTLNPEFDQRPNDFA